MSTTKNHGKDLGQKDLGQDPDKSRGVQPNSEGETGANGNTHSHNRSRLPMPLEPAQVELGTKEAGQKNGVNGGHVQNGVNGVHSPDSPEDEAQASASELAADADESTNSTAADPAVADSAVAADDAVEAEVASPTAGLSTPRSAVKIKGRPGGVSLELGEGEWDELILLLEERLHAAEGFFRGGRVLLEVGERLLDAAQLRQVRELLETHEMELVLVRSTAEDTLQAASDVGISTTNEEAQETLHVPEPPLIVDDGPPNAYTPSAYAPPPEIIAKRPNHFVHRGSLRSGQVLRKTESIVIIGDVNPGANVISGGDIMVWGRLRGIAHAGAEGNRRSVVAAIDFEPTQLRIANLTAIAPERPKTRRGKLFFWKKEPERRPEIARVIDGRIVVEPWDESKPNGLGMWRK